MKKTFAMVVLCLVLGFAAGKITSSPNHPIPSAEIPDWKAKIQDLADHDLAEYARLKTLEERYKKADEILGKIIQIFIADLGIHALSAQNSGNVDNKTGTREIVLSGKTTTASPNKLQAIYVTDSWKKAESSLESGGSDFDSSEFLQKTRIEDFGNQLLNHTQNFSNRTGLLEAITGGFSGTAQVTEPEKSPQYWKVEMMFTGKLDQSELSGKATVKLFDSTGKIFSNSDSSGNVDTFREFSSDSKALIVRVSPDIHFQLYYLRTESAFIGNVYKIGRKTQKNEWIGTLRLTKNG